ncbi:MAG: gliding motility-associated ABC transporter ATP-binding subunit GldA [Chitinophagaceae bacterium]
MSIQLEGLSKNYGTQKAVDSISFGVAKGEIVGFLGPNGAGKSTTMKMITGYLMPDEGKAFVNGINVVENPKQAKAVIGYLPESNPLYYDMYVREYLGFIAGLHQLKNPKEHIEEVIVKTGLSLESGKKTGQLSKGYKQRVGLAAALIHEPEVLILDEPTSGLDPNQIVEIRELIKEFGKNKTVLFSSHILQEIEAICDRVIIINRGKLVANDSLNSLQQYKAKNETIIVHFKEKVDVSDLRALEGSASVEDLQNAGFRIGTTNAESLKRLLLRFALDKNLNIISIQSESQSLEDIFRDLTKQP